MTIRPLDIGDEAPTALYRLYDAKDRLLYVGITSDLMGRLTAHADKPWWPDVARKTAEWHPTRASAAEAEMKAIRSEDPVHNIAGTNPSGGPRLRSEIRSDISGNEIVALAMTKMPPVSLRLAMLELAGMTTREALDALGVGPTHRHRVIYGRLARVALGEAEA